MPGAHKRATVMATHVLANSSSGVQGGGQATLISGMSYVCDWLVRLPYVQSSDIASNATRVAMLSACAGHYRIGLAYNICWSYYGASSMVTQHIFTPSMHSVCINGQLQWLTRANEWHPWQARMRPTMLATGMCIICQVCLLGVQSNGMANNASMLAIRLSSHAI